jgi:signal transduction histidine kinase
VANRLPRAGGASIAARLTWGNVLVSGVALLLAAVALGAYDRATFREAAVRNLSIQAQIVGANSVSALVFNDANTAGITLAALNASPNIVSAAIRTPDARIFASYTRDGGGPVYAPLTIPPGQSEVQRLDATGIVLTRRINFQGKPIGSVSIQSDLREFDARRTRSLGIIAAVMVVSLIAALVMSWLSQRAISKPIVHLAEIANSVSGNKDYSARAPVAGGPREIAVLTEAFNDMLTQIQERDASLRTAQDSLEARVLDRTAELDLVNKELEAFSYSVSHDLRAPLRHVTGFASLLEEHAQGQLDGQSRKYLETIAQAAKRMGQLIDDLLLFSRMGRSQVATRHVSLNELVRDVREEMQAEGGTASRHIDWHVADLPGVEGDSAMLRLVISNLLSNAIKYTAPRPEARIEVGAGGAAADEVVVFVRDNGVGFDMQYVDKLFGVFQRLHRSDEFEGTGIGLANVRRIIHRHGGRVWAEGEIDRGATFYFSLPRKGGHA